jgi:two-component system phosphate regulon sensor histidine kinase PhoR
MKKRIYLSLLGISIGAIIITLIFVTYGFFRTVQKQTLTMLSDTASVLAARANEEDDLIGFLQDTANGSDRRLRLTWIGQGGEVLYESDYDAHEMENHGSRPEVMRALKENTGFATRQSSTLNHVTYYSAHRLKDGTVLRVAIKQNTVYAAYFRMIPYLLLLIALLIISCLIVTSRLTRSLLRPLTETADYMRLLGTQHLAEEESKGMIPKPPETYPELKPLVDKITDQSQTIQNYIQTLEEDKETIQRISQEQEVLRREFTANVTHELKTPLTSIRGFAEILSAGMFKSKEDVAHFGELICKESKRLLELINSILFLTKIEGKENKDLNVAVNMRALIENVASFMDPVLKEKEVHLHLKLTDDKVSGDSEMLREVIMNLIDNAVKYNRPSGHVYVTMEQDPSGENLLLIVQDTGIGIPQDKQGRVFERFYRVDASRSKKIGGTGLGLSIVKHIIEQHHGTINLESRENFGTRITVSLPLYKEQPSPINQKTK